MHAARARGGLQAGDDKYVRRQVIWDMMGVIGVLLYITLQVMYHVQE